MPGKVFHNCKSCNEPYMIDLDFIYEYYSNCDNCSRSIEAPFPDSPTYYDFKSRSTEAPFS